MTTRWCPLPEAGAGRGRGERQEGRGEAERARPVEEGDPWPLDGVYSMARRSACLFMERRVSPLPLRGRMLGEAAV